MRPTEDITGLVRRYEDEQGRARREAMLIRVILEGHWHGDDKLGRDQFCHACDRERM